MTQEEFRETMKIATAIVDTWPEWKKNILEYSSKSTVSVPREPILEDEY